MKIFLIIPTLNQGGAERVISELANQFSKSGYEVHLVILVKSIDFYVVSDNVYIHRLGFTNKGMLQKPFSELKVLINLRRLFKEYRPDAILSFMDKYNILTILSSRFLDLRVFISDRSNPKLKLSLFLYFLKKIFYRRATGIIAQTSLAKEVIQDISNSKNVKVIPNPLKYVCLFPEVSREKIIINVGRMVPEKGHKYLIESFAQLGIVGWKLVILGDGPLRYDLEKQVAELGLIDKVSMPGTVSNIDDWLAKSSIFVFSSVSEGFPNALVEAMAAGLPCISFDCEAGPRDIIEHGVNGLLVEEKNIDNLKQSMEKLINDSSLAAAIGKKAQTVRNSYNINSIEKIYIDYLLGK